MAVFYSLIPFTLSHGSDGRWLAKVKTGKTTIEDVAQIVVESGSEYSYETLVKIFKQMEGAIRNLVESGHTVTTKNAIYLPIIKGVFGPSGEWDGDANSYSCTMMPSKSFRRALEAVHPAFTGQLMDEGDAAITSVKDVTTGTVNSTITPGGAIIVTGKKIKCVGAAGEDACTIRLLDAQTNEVAASVDALLTNNAGRLAFVCPDVAAGRYVLEVSTYYSTGGQLKSARKITSDVLTVL